MNAMAADARVVRPAGTGTLERVLRVVRLQMLNRWTFIGIPLVILSGALLLSFLLFFLIPPDAPVYVGGAAAAPMWYFIGIGVQALTLTFPFSQAMGITRLEFFLGSLLTALITAAGLAVIYITGAIVETATNGWGREGYFFRIPYTAEQGPAVSGLMYCTLMLFLFVAGFLCATVYKRWGVVALVAGLLTVVAALVLTIVAITRMNAWQAVGDAFTTLGVAGASAIALALTAVLAALAYLPLRRTVA